MLAWEPLSLTTLGMDSVSSCPPRSKSHFIYVISGCCDMLVPLAAAAEIGPIEFQNQWALLIRSLAFSPVDGRPHPVSGSMSCEPQI